jgi:MFS family permease
MTLGARTAVGGWGVRDRKGFVSLASIVFLDIAVQDGFLVFVAFLMVAKQVPPALAAFAVVATLAGGVCGKFACGHLAAKLGIVRSLVLVQSLTAILMTIVFLSPTIVAFMLLPLLGIVLQGSSSISYATVSNFVHDARQSRGFAAIYTMSNGASVAGPLVFGFVADSFRLGVSVAAMVGATLITLPLALCLRSALKRTDA